MKRWLLAIPLALGLFAATTAPSVGAQDVRIVVRLPFSEAQCRALIARSALFQLGGPDTGPGDCFVIVIGGMPRR